ncbi:Uncharacterised protein [Raoultella terrigena]|uniref:Uncharacterized protein n=1 Tax=Raoultella terrigena TaxID=577 RepID=A0A4U9D9A6_RAOTE|nr:Uncharacterised protein [Raoultella terrigena]
MLAEHVAGGAGDIRHNSGFTPGQRVQQARFPGVRAPGNHHLHSFTQQAALTGLGANRVEIGHHVVKLGLYFAVGRENHFLIREVDGRFDVDTQVRQRFHQVVNARGEGALQRVQRRTRRLLGAGVNQVSNRLGLSQVELIIEKRAFGELSRVSNAQARKRQDALSSRSRMTGPPCPAARGHLRR